MKNTKNILAMSLATIMTLAPMTTFAEIIKAEEVKEAGKIEGEVEVKDLTEEEKTQEIKLNFEIKESDYVYNEATIKEVKISEDKKTGSILVEQTLEEGKKNEIIYIITDQVTLVDGKEREVVGIESLKEGMKLKIFFGRNTPMLLSYPGQMIPKVIAIDNMEDGTVFVDNFDEDLISKGHKLKLNISEETEIVDTKGESVEDIKGRDLIVFFGASTRSIPAQTTPYKVIVLDDEKVEDVKEEEVDIAEKVLNKLVVRDKTIELETSMYEDEDVLMLPVREVGQALGYTVDWKDEDNSVLLSKEDSRASFKIGDKKYKFDEEVELKVAPKLEDGKAYAPVDFFENLLKVENTGFNVDGILELK